MDYVMLYNECNSSIEIKIFFLKKHSTRDSIESIEYPLFCCSLQQQQHRKDDEDEREKYVLYGDLWTDGDWIALTRLLWG